jgi:putative heme-binding domain-containing protein
VQHTPTPAGCRTGKGNAYETDLRDKKHGRIYRVVHTAAPPSEPMSLAGAGPEKLVATLAHPNLFWRRHAQRLLVERGQKDVLDALVALASLQSTDAIGLNPGAIHALWTLDGLGALNGSHPAALAAAEQALRHPSAGVRMNAARVLPSSDASTRALLAAGVLADPDGRVRLAALLALADMPASAAAGQAVAGVLADAALLGDRWTSDAATSAAAVHDRHVLAAVSLGKQPLPARGAEIAAIVAEHFARGAPLDQTGPLVAALVDADLQTAEAIVRGLAKGWPRDRQPQLEPDTEQALSRLAGKLSAAGRGQVLRLASAWGSRQLVEQAAEPQPEAARTAAARELIALRPDDPQVARRLLALVTPRAAPGLTQGLFDAVAASTAPEVAAAIIDLWPGMTPAVRPGALGVLLARESWSQSLLEAVEQGKLALGDLTLDQKQALAAHPNRQLARRAQTLLERQGGLPNPDRQKVVEALAGLAQQTGDAARGKEVFTKNCTKCHTHSGVGNHVGPDLTGMAVHPKLELLVQILDPSRSVEGNYRMYTVVTTSGRVLNGLLAAESRTSIEVIDAEGKRHQVQRDDVEELVASPKSLMPEGFEKQVPEQDILDLLEFLTQRGRYLPLSLEKAATIVSTRGMFFSEDAAAERLVFSDWGVKTVEGVPFHLVDPQGERVPNVVLLYGPQGKFPPRMPRSVRLTCNTPARAVHLLSGVSGWGHPASREGTVSLIVRLHYQDGQSEDHPLRNGEHFADYIRRVDVPGSEFAFSMAGKQMRYLTVTPKRAEAIAEIEFVKGDDQTAPIIMAVTVEPR